MRSLRMLSHEVCTSVVEIVPALKPGYPGLVLWRGNEVWRIYRGHCVDI